ncbi:hypothetical protein SAMN05428960_2604 [Mitsuaria sp. PDC51]|uniref:hypothetical protein n=1 Tax=Mitsuaria sp. PDC51 TaxID=1881035 RepID=UPI0008E7D256|nr:hypothetical protein [Mitsuaria sp. PDC51]SFR87935.1 hypothetical protein SAMN05428960_2604 [Mitsuaria sp. PDC51]
MNKKTLAALAALSVAGCTSPLHFKQTPEGSQTVENLDEAGSVHVAVLAVTPWDEVKAKLRPNLKIDDKDLRNQAIPVTFTLLDKYLDILRFQASLAPTVVKNTASSSTTTETGKEDVTKTTTSQETAPGQARKTDLAGALPAGSAPSVAASGISAINSSLTARAMASFVQDVQALNAEVDGAAKRTGFTPYLFRVQVSVMPRRRHLGYDVYSNLSFFGYEGAFDAATGAATSRTHVNGTPFVVPLLSSDSIETAQRSQSIEAIRDVGVALDLVKGFGAAGFSVGSQKDRQQALQGLDVNSVLTLGRLSDNTLRVRFGAAYDPGGGFAVHPRTNTISVLVFFPTKATQTRVVSRSAWTNVLDGTVLERSAERYRAKLQPIVDQWKHLGVDIPLLERIDELPTEGNYGSFVKLMDKSLARYCEAKTSGAPSPEDRSANCTGSVHRLSADDNKYERDRNYTYLWSHLLSVLPGSRFSTTVVDLPRLAPICPVGKQLAAYVEDDKGLSVALRGGNDLGVGTLKAVMHWGYLGALKIPAPANPQAQAHAQADKNQQKAVESKPATKPAASAKPADAEKLAVKGYAGAQVASEITVSDDRKSATFSFAADRMVPVSWSDNGKVLAPVAIEVAGCYSGTAEALPTELTGAKRAFDDKSQVYALKVFVPKKDKADNKAKPTVSLSVSSTDLIASPGGVGATRVTVDLGESPTTGFALTASGAVIQLVGPAASIEQRADGSYLVKKSGTVDITFMNVSENKSIDIDLKPVDEKGKLGGSAAKVSLLGRKSNKG